MEALTVGGLTVYFPTEERAAAELVRQACAAGIPLIHRWWGVATPQEVRVYVATSSWLPALFHAAPWRWRPLLVVSLPLWYLVEGYFTATEHVARDRSHGASSNVWRVVS